ncbi:DUF4264 family protein [Tumebacillus permanentifrigoris]|uniref:Uncharacterized protein DUF4264 n=1 Tax=Tumebacillus permanentifrigoris TaxID=378543 RepID=A0A316DCY1_9BACL|nr:DUF4264 family protein [Tumebacillus permanentifrigoris]PWK15588.1 uncharacterized protein DUF4264 [Tumebacillus permanentifrigoris]
MDTTEHVTIANVDLPNPTELYLVVDFLNHTLKDWNLVFGLSKAEEQGDLQLIVYEERKQ